MYANIVQCLVLAFFLWYELLAAGQDGLLIRRIVPQGGDWQVWQVWSERQETYLDLTVTLTCWVNENNSHISGDFLIYRRRKLPCVTTGVLPALAVHSLAHDCPECGHDLLHSTSVLLKCCLLPEGPSWTHSLLTFCRTFLCHMRDWVTNR